MEEGEQPDWSTGEVGEQRKMAHGDGWQPRLELGTDSCGFRPPSFLPEVVAGGRAGYREVWRKEGLSVAHILECL